MSRFRVALAGGDDREIIYRLRHAVYAGELGQHSVNEEGRLRDALDDFNEYVVVRDKEIAGATNPRGFGLGKDEPFPGRSIRNQLKLRRLLPPPPAGGGGAPAPGRPANAPG